MTEDMPTQETLSKLTEEVPMWLSKHVNDPHADMNPPHTVWMAMQACRVEIPTTAKSLSRNLLMSSFSGCLKVTRKNVKMPLKPWKRELKTMSQLSFAPRLQS